MPYTEELIQQEFGRIGRDPQYSVSGLQRSHPSPCSIPNANSRAPRVKPRQSEGPGGVKYEPPPAIYLRQAPSFDLMQYPFRRRDDT